MPHNWHANDGRRCPKMKGPCKCLVQADARENILNAAGMAPTDSHLRPGAALVVSLGL